jgi:hypothetical protein
MGFFRSHADASKGTYIPLGTRDERSKSTQASTEKAQAIILSTTNVFFYLVILAAVSIVSFVAGMHFSFAPSTPNSKIIKLLDRKFNVLSFPNHVYSFDRNLNACDINLGSNVSKL